MPKQLGGFFRAGLTTKLTRLQSRVPFLFMCLSGPGLILLGLRTFNPVGLILKPVAFYCSKSETVP